MTEPAHNDNALTVHLTVHLDREPVRGQLCGEGGDPQQFVGWIGFVEALKRAQRTSRNPTTTEAPGDADIGADDGTVIRRAAPNKRAPVSRARNGDTMGHPVVHFEVIGQDGTRLQSYYSELFGWEIDAANPIGYGGVQREGNTNAEGVGIGGGVGTSPQEGYAGHVTFYVEVPDVEVALAKAQSLGGTRVFGPDEVPGTGVVLGQFTDPEGHLIGLMQSAT